MSKLTSPAPELKPGNIMIKVEDPVILEESARDEYEHPLPQKSCSDGRTIYLSRNDFGISDETTGIIQFTDLICLSAGIGQIGGVSRRKYTEGQRPYWMQVIRTVPIFGA